MLRTRCIRLVGWGIICLGLIVSGCIMLRLWYKPDVTPERALMNAINRKPACKLVPKPKAAESRKIDPTTAAIRRWTAAAAQNGKPHRRAAVRRRPASKKKPVRTAHRNKPRKARHVRTADKTHPVAATLWP